MSDILMKAVEHAAKVKNFDLDAVKESHGEFVAREKELQTKAYNEVFEGANAGFGAEIRVPVEYASAEYSFINRNSLLLSKVRGDNGQVHADSKRISNVGEAGYFDAIAELTGAYTFTNLQPSNAPQTDALLINIRQFNTRVAISAEEMDRTTESNIIAVLMNRIAAAADMTIESYCINADTDETATNINFGGQVVPANYHEAATTILGNDGLRKTAIAAGNVVGNAGTVLTRGTYQNMLDKVINYANNPSDLLWIASNKFANQARFLSEFSTMDVFKTPTNTVGGFVGAPEGIEMYASREMPNFCEAGGEVISDGTLNVTGRMNKTSVAGTSCLLIHKDALQYAFGQSMNIVPLQTASGVLYDVSFWFGAGVANNKANLGQTVSLAVCTA